MGLIFLKVLDSLAASLRAFTPAKIREWRRLIVASGFVVVIAIVLLALVFIHVVSELNRMGYGPRFFILWMNSLGGSR
jgi:uncharacterized membrane protein YdbT with pleckstrin-like domain